MQLIDAKNMAARLMNEHGLIADGWYFEWSRGKMTLGSASASRKRIKLSYHYATLNDADEVRDTILHEIAHAKVGPGNGHNHVWRAMCIQIGAKPTRCSTTATSPPPNYLVVCPVHGTIATRYRRRAAHKMLEYSCKRCGKSSLGLLQQVSA